MFVRLRAATARLRTRTSLSASRSADSAIPPRKESFNHSLADIHSKWILCREEDRRVLMRIAIRVFAHETMLSRWK